MTTIACSKCGVIKDESEYHRYRKYSTGYRPDCKACRYLVAKSLRERNPEKHKQQCVAWQKANPDRVKAIQKKHSDANREKRRQLSRKWQKENLAKGAAFSARKRALVASATPSWASRAYIDIFYEIAKLEEKRTGRKVHVDHIVPLNSSIVCGLHVDDNLQLLFAEDNIRKKNHFLGE